MRIFSKKRVQECEARRKPRREPDFERAKHSEKSGEALLRSEQIAFLSKNNKQFLKFKEIMFCGNIDLMKNRVNDNFANENFREVGLNGFDVDGCNIEILVF